MKVDLRIMTGLWYEERKCIRKSQLIDLAQVHYKVCIRNCRKRNIRNPGRIDYVNYVEKTENRRRICFHPTAVRNIKILNCNDSS